MKIFSVNDVQVLLQKITEPDGSPYIILEGGHFSVALGSILLGRGNAYGQAELLHAELGPASLADELLQSGGTGLPQDVKFLLVGHVSGPLQTI
jgi:hypothetical protein